MRKRVIELMLVLLALCVSGTALAGAALTARYTPVIPVIDGDPGDSAWANAVEYPFAFNQLDQYTQVWMDFDNLQASFKLLYNGETLYGIVYRQDDYDQTGNSSPVYRDGVELFFDVYLRGGSGVQLANKTNGQSQIRAVIGETFDDVFPGVPVKTAWNKDNTVLEFAVPLGGNLMGATIGFSIAINDADEGLRDQQLYPFPGFNKAWNSADALGLLYFE
jgi:endo-1,4-beta-xylanase